MKSIAITASLLLLAMIAAACPIDAQQDMTIDDKDINVLLFEEMEYPSVALQTRIQGVVIVRAALDDLRAGCGRRGDELEGSLTRRNLDISGRHD
jgi:hypothetical protein